MATILDYLIWCADKPISAEAPFNDLDALALSAVCYLDLLPAANPGGASIREVADQYMHPGENPTQRRDRQILLLRRMARSVRFRDARMMGFVNIIDDEPRIQFSAVTCRLPQVGTFICFRGTDATLVGWHEDFAMLYESPVASQTAAVAYVEQAAKVTTDRLFLCGHSKGGNLSVYAAVHTSSEIRKRIRAVWSFDGPGLDDASLNLPAYREVKDRMRSILPEASFIGLLLGYNTDYIVVRSDAQGMGQHDLFSWLTREPDSFELTGEAKFYSKVIDRTMHDCLSEVSMEDRRKIIDSIFYVVESSGAKSLSDLKGKLLLSLPAALATVGGLDQETRDVVSNQFRSALAYSAGNVVTEGASRLINKFADRLLGNLFGGGKSKK